MNIKLVICYLSISFNHNICVLRSLCLVVTQGWHVLQRRLSPLFSPNIGSTTSEVLRYGMSYNAAVPSDD